MGDVLAGRQVRGGRTPALTGYDGLNARKTTIPAPDRSVVEQAEGSPGSIRAGGGLSRRLPGERIRACASLTYLSLSEFAQTPDPPVPPKARPIPF